MTWLAPLGFLGLVGLIILILIYIIKPNFQLRYISTTYVWRKSLKFRKKKRPLNKLRNILLFICQVGVLVGATCILAQPFIQEDTSKSEGDVVLIQFGHNDGSDLVWRHTDADTSFVNNLCIFVDNNDLQIDGRVGDVMSPYPIPEKLKAFGFAVAEIDAHDFD
ncbi:MAG: BatA domain-containing protein, partial [Firmicutes bacterium]|nr:BatA domain-containing protein [Bacillota bacterium]